MLDIGYVGNKTTGIKNNALARLNQLPSSVLTQYGRNLTNPVTNADQAAAAGIAYPFAGYRGTVAGALRQYPQLSGTNTIGPYAAPLGFANFHSLQVTVDKQMSKGLSVYANYVWSKSLSNTESSFVGDNGGPLDYYNLQLEKTVTSFDRPHALKGFVQYELPFGKGTRHRSLLPRVECDRRGMGHVGDRELQQRWSAGVWRRLLAACRTGGTAGSVRTSPRET